MRVVTLVNASKYILMLFTFVFLFSSRNDYLPINIILISLNCCNYRLGSVDPNCLVYLCRMERKSLCAHRDWSTHTQTTTTTNRKNRCLKRRLGWRSETKERIAEKIQISSLYAGWLSPKDGEKKTEKKVYKTPHGRHNRVCVCTQFWICFVVYYFSLRSFTFLLRTSIAPCDTNTNIKSPKKINWNRIELYFLCLGLASVSPTELNGWGHWGGLRSKVNHWVIFTNGKL